MFTRPPWIKPTKFEETIEFVLVAVFGAVLFIGQCVLLWMAYKIISRYA